MARNGLEKVIPKVRHAPDDSKMAKMASRFAQDGPRWPKMSSMSAQDGPRCPQDGPKTSKMPSSSFRKPSR
eukprot:9313748-Pyramimonas_sp.AAC.1